MRFIPATRADLDHVFDWLAPRHRDEIRALGISDSTAYTAAALWLARSGGATLLVDGEPACVFGVHDGYTWFVATDAYYAAGAAAVRASRRHLLSLAGPVMTISSSKHPDAARWFKALGFEKVRETCGSTLYRLRSTKPTKRAISSAERTYNPELVEPVPLRPRV